METVIGTTKIITDSKLVEIGYPVGIDLHNNIPICKHMARVLAGHIESLGMSTKDICFVVQGSSGAIVGSLVAQYFEGSRILDIKKDTIRSHSHHTLYVPSETYYFVFVDDFISTGATYNACYDELLSLKRIIDCVLVSGDLSYTIFEEYPVDTIICQNYYSPVMTDR